MELMYIVSGDNIRPIKDEKDILKFLTSGNEDVFLVNGKDDEIYIIEDLPTIKKMKHLSVIHPESVALDLMLKIVNPNKYK